MPDPRKTSLHLALIVALSLIVHAMILSLPLRMLEPEPDTESRSITLVRTPAPAPETTPEATAELPPPEPAAIAAPRTEEQTPPVPPAPAPAQAQLSTEERSEIETAEIRRQALDLAGQAAEAPDRPEDQQTELYRSAPRLPGGGGWMSSYVGPVATGREQWQEIDGGLHSRTVLSSGQVICTSIRAPTAQEFFNPWMSAAVPMMRRCGRERPEQSTDSDPWQRAAGR